MTHIKQEVMLEWIESENIEAIKEWIQATDYIDYVYQYVDYFDDDVEEDDYFDFYYEEKYSHPALFLAVCAQKPAIVKLLLEHGANPNVQPHDRHHALYVAIEKQNVMLVDLLLSFGADVHRVGKYKKTPLMCAVSDISTINRDEKWQYDSLHPAKKQIKLLIINLLLEAGANPLEKVEGFPLSALDIAKQRNDKQVIYLLESYIENDIN